MNPARNQTRLVVQRTRQGSFDNDVLHRWNSVADAASNVWEPIVRMLLEAMKPLVHAKNMSSDFNTNVLKAQFALGEIPNITSTSKKIKDLEFKSPITSIPFNSTRGLQIKIWADEHGYVAGTDAEGQLVIYTGIYRDNNGDFLG